MPLAKGLLKVCSRCKVEKTLLDFSKSKQKSDGLEGECKVCRRQYRKNRLKTNPIAKRSFENSRMKHLYGISLETYEVMLQIQNNVCAICGEKQSNKSHGRLCVDHSHITKKVRGLLCDNCNIALGRLKNLKNILSAAKYIELHGE